jgi:hypothetical protein
MSKLHIDINKAYSLVEDRAGYDATMKLPYKVKFINQKNKVSYTNNIPLKYLTQAMTCRYLKHSAIEEAPQEVPIESITSCYLIGSAVHPRYEMVTKKYLWGLYIKEKEEQVVANDIDIICFVNSTYQASHIKSLTTWTITISGAYGSYTRNEYGSFDVSYYPASMIHRDANRDFMKHLRDHGVCMMGKNIAGSQKYAVWEHDAIKDKISCFVPREQNIFGNEEETETEEVFYRSEILDL